MDILQELGKRGAVLEGHHFVYQSDKHGSGYVNVDPAFPDVGFVKALCRDLVDPFLGEFHVIVGPAKGGIVLAFVGAIYAHKRGHRVSAIWADKDEVTKWFRFERDGFAQTLQGKRVLVVDDVMTNPNKDGSVYKVCRLVQAWGGNVIGASIICNRCGGTAQELEIPRLESLCSVSFQAVPEANCSLCEQGVPIVTDVGHGDQYQALHPDYKGGYTTLLS
jgi:orotate phosphoribosyltransferase